MANVTTKKKSVQDEKADIRRVNLSFTAEEYELLEEQAQREFHGAITPTGFAKVLVIKGLNGAGK